MAVRTDITVLPYLSPRLIRIESPSTEVTLQDLHDTLRAWEDSVDGETYNILVDSTGKQDLGGGVAVGITSALQNALVSFAARTTSISSGTVTTGDVTGESLIDAAATFIADGVIAGAWVVNFTDFSVGTVLNVVSETELLVEAMADGTDNQLVIADVYKIWNVVQCNAAGGNLTAVNDVGAAVDPIFPTMGTQPVRAAASSSTSQNSSAIEYSSFGGGIHIDVLSANSGTDFPTGTAEFPVNNLADAHQIAESRGFTTFFIRGDLTVATEIFADGHTFIGQSEALSAITINPAADVTNCEFRDAVITGTLDGGNTLRGCLIDGLDVVNGFVVNCGLSGTTTLGGLLEANFLNCHGDGGGTTPILDFGGSGQDLLMNNYSGAIRLTNKTGTDYATIDILSGEIIIDATVTAGTVTIRGSATLVDNSGAGATIDTSGLVYADQLQLISFRGEVVIDVAGGTAGTKFPLGTIQDPVSNLADALLIAVARGINTFRINGVLVVGAAAVIDGYTLIGANQLDSVVVLQSGASTEKTRFRDMILKGVAGGAIQCVNVGVFDVSNIGSIVSPTVFRDCVLAEGTIGFAAGLVSPKPVLFVDCVTGVATTGAGTTLDCNGTNIPTALQKYGGEITITNCTNAAHVMEIGMAQGEVTVNASNTAGTLALRGVAQLVNNTGGMTVDTEGLLYTDSVQLIAFNNHVRIDTVLGIAGTAFPQGTHSSPVSNLADALSIATSRGLSKLLFTSDYTFLLTDVLDGYDVIGRGMHQTKLYLTAGVSTVFTQFFDAGLFLSLGGSASMERCHVENVQNVGGATELTFRNCHLAGSMVLDPAFTGEIEFQDCRGGDLAVAAGFNLNGAVGPIIYFSGWVGPLAIRGMTGGGTLEVDLYSGHVTLESTVSTGSVELRGTGKVNNNSTGTATVEDEVVKGNVIDQIAAIVKAILGLS